MRDIADKQLLDHITRSIVQMADPDRIILFGSRARGEAKDTSDIDIVVVTASEEPRYRRARPLYTALRHILVPMDIVVYTPEEIAEWQNVRQAFITTALREGILLYEKQN